MYFLTQEQSADDDTYIRGCFADYQTILANRRGDYGGMICVVTRDGRVARGGVAILHFDARPGTEVDAEYLTIEDWANATADETGCFIDTGVYGPVLELPE